jgi:protein-L-isoaspartate(D-aspartate) O-methyltransferase
MHSFNKPEDFAAARAQMVEHQLMARGIRDPAVFEAMRAVPRDAFVPSELRPFAYEDRPLPIANEQTISQPYIVARMIEAADVHAGDRVLEVGTGSGYAAAVLARIAARVDTIERHGALAHTARAALAAMGADNVEVHCADGTLGWPDAAPFDAILAAAGGPAVPLAWREQLAPGGRLVMPVGGRPMGQRLVKLTRTGLNRFDQQDLGVVYFVPLIGLQGWPDDVNEDVNESNVPGPSQRG